VRPEVRKVIILWAVITVIGIGLAFLVPGVMPTAAANDQHEVRLTMLVFTILAAPVIALVVAIGIYSLIAWRSGPGDAPTEDGPPIRENTTVLATWIGVSSALVLFLLVWGFAELQSSAANAAPGAIVVNVTGQQWIWSFEYPNATQSERLVLPVNKPVVLDITSEDVVHGFWIPNFGVKADANPGETTQIVVTPTTIGTFPIRCAELCGLYHAYMDSTVSVVSQSDFETWLSQGIVPVSPAGTTGD
jgi:cytochrome c oxidase subunit 2